MTDTINLPRNLVEEILKTCAFTLTEISYRELRARLADQSDYLKSCEAAHNALAGPAPPAGGEPEVAFFIGEGTLGSLSRPVTSSRDVKAYRAHKVFESSLPEGLVPVYGAETVTRLQAEVNSLKAERDAAVRWQETVRDSSLLVQQRDRAQSELTKARELLVQWVIQAPAHAERLISESKAVIGSTKKTETKCNRCGADTACGKMLCEACCYEPMQASNQSAPADKGQPRGALIRYREYVGTGEGGREIWHNWSDWSTTTVSFAESKLDQTRDLKNVQYEVQSLYAEQPAPVAVVKS